MKGPKHFVPDTNVLLHNPEAINSFGDKSDRRFLPRRLASGLAYAVEKLKGQPLYGHVTLSKSERSPLSAVAAEFL